MAKLYPPMFFPLLFGVQTLELMSFRMPLLDYPPFKKHCLLLAPKVGV